MFRMLFTSVMFVEICGTKGLYSLVWVNHRRLNTYMKTMTELLDIDAGKHTEAAQKTLLLTLDQIHTQLFENVSALYYIKKQYLQCACWHFYFCHYFYDFACGHKLLDLIDCKVSAMASERQLISFCLTAYIRRITSERLWPGQEAPIPVISAPVMTSIQHRFMSHIWLIFFYI